MGRRSADRTRAVAYGLNARPVRHSAGKHAAEAFNEQFAVPTTIIFHRPVETNPYTQGLAAAYNQYEAV